MPLPSCCYPYNLALVCAFFRMGSILVAFMTSPLTLSFPDMNSRCALALPETSLPKSSSESERVTGCTRRGQLLRINCATKEKKKKRILTSRLGPRARGDGALLLEVDVPALGLPGLVLQGEGEYGIPLFNGVFTVGLAGLKHGVDGLKCFGGRKLVCGKQGLVVRVSQSEQGINSLFAYREMRQDCLPFLSPMMPDCDIKMP